MKVGTIDIDQVTLDVVLKHSNKAKRIGLRLSNNKNQVVVSLPRGTSAAHVNSLLKEARPWITKHLKPKPSQIPFNKDAAIPIFGQEYRITHKDSIRKSIWLEDTSKKIIVHPAYSDPGYMESWLRHHAKSHLAKLTREYAQQIGQKANRVSVREVISRWGSCSSTGNISYSWRLIFAPIEVSNYVCAHEVSHLKEMSHSPKFWEAVHSLCPDFALHRQWLKKNGHTLFRFG